MNAIISPLKPEDKGQAVADLQDALQQCLDRKALWATDQATRQACAENLKPERASQIYGKTTAKLVAQVQGEYALTVNSEVDKLTAAALNKLLKAWGLLAQSSVEMTRVAFDSKYIVRCQLVNARSLPISGLRVEAYDQDPKSPHDPLGEPAHSDAQGMVTFRFQRSDFVEHAGERGPDLYFKIYNDTVQLAYTVLKVNSDKGILRNFQQQREPLILCIDRYEILQGIVLNQRKLPVENLRLRLYRLELGGQSRLLVETTTQAGGHYTFIYDAGGWGARLEVRMVKADQSEIPLAEPLNDLKVEFRTLLHLQAPVDVQTSDSEYRRLETALKPHIGNMTVLKGLKEEGRQKDFTELHRKCGWDARLIVLASLSERLASEEGLPAEALYGLLRAGLPSDRALLAQVEPDAVVAALKAVREAGIIGIDGGEIKAFHADFKKFRVAARLSLSIPGGNTSYQKMLTSVDLGEKQEKFAEVFTSFGDDPTLLWREARNVLSSPQVAKLQLQGKLALLTGSSQEMTTHLLKMQLEDTPNGSKKPLTDPAQLVELGLYSAEAWEAQLAEAAKESANNMESLIPSAFIGSPERRRRAFTEEMARKIRISYPMHVLAHEIGMDSEDDFRLGEHAAGAAKILRRMAGLGFRMGETSVDAFLDARPGLTGDLLEKEQRRLRYALKDLQRTYQISTSNSVMKMMRQHGLYAATDVTSMSKSHFIEYYAHHFPSRQTAELIYRKAEQISSVVYNMFAIAKQVESQVVVYGASAPEDVRQSIKNELIKQFPTMESLFGSMDYCECEHCRSVLSPAAYLVDLLQFVDVESAVWSNFIDKWAENHDTEYQSDWNDPDNNTREPEKRRPYDALIERRPDLPHIALTCENTHTAMPYIDIVNEILEYYVANGALTPDAARDTGDANTPELLAEPQNVIREAYETVRAARYPLTLPVDVWLETVRQFCDFAETPLHTILETFRPGDELHAPLQSYDRAAVFIESLGFSPAEAAIFIDPDPLAAGKWYALFGYATTGPEIFISTNTSTNATLTLANEAMSLAVGTPVTYRDVSIDAIHGETLTVSAIGAADSGGSGRMLITLNGRWVTPPVAGDRLIVAAPALLQSAKTLARRLGVTYKELVEIIKTGFVNPRLVQLSLLYKLGVSIADVLFYGDSHNRAIYDDHKDLLNRERAKMSNAEQARFDELTKSAPNTGVSGWETINRVEALLNRLKAASGEFPFFDAVDWVDKALAEDAFENVLMLMDPDTGCSFDATVLCYANGSAPAAIDFLRINLFVRLWRKLGWTIEETDQALTIFTQKTPFTQENLRRQPLQAALIYIAHLKILEEQTQLGKNARLKLLTLWSDLTTTGKNPLYAQLFLNRNILKSGEVEIGFDDDSTRLVSIFDHPLGLYLDPDYVQDVASHMIFRASLEDVTAVDQLNPNDFAHNSKVHVEYDSLRKIQTLTYQGDLTVTAKTDLLLASTSPILPKLLDAVQGNASEIIPHFTLIHGHLPALQGALGLTASEIDQILTATNQVPALTELTLANVSLLYRYGLLAKALNLSVKEFITLKTLAGPDLDPFEMLSGLPEPPDKQKLEEDHPYSKTLRFVEIAEEIKGSSFKIEDVEYLLRHRFDPTGQYRPKPEEEAYFLKTLAEGIQAIRLEHALPDDLSVLTNETLQQKLGLILSPDVAQRFLAMLNGTFEFTVTHTVLATEASLEFSVFNDEPAIISVSPLNTVRNEQKLTYRGVLRELEQKHLETKYLNKLSQERMGTFKALLAGVRQQAQDFFATYLHRQTDIRPESGFLGTEDFEYLFAASPFNIDWSEAVILAMEGIGSTEVNPPASIKGQFVAHGISISSEAKICKVGENLWRMKDNRRTSVIVKESDHLNIKGEAVSFAVDISQPERSTLKEAITKISVETGVPEGMNSDFIVEGIQLTDQAKVHSIGDNLWQLADTERTFELSLIGETLHVKEYVAFAVDLSPSDRFVLRQALTKVTANALVEATVRELFAANGIPLSEQAEIAKMGSTLWQINDKGRVFELSRIGVFHVKIEKYGMVAQAFYPCVQQRLIKQFILQALIAETGANAQLVERLVTDDQLLQGLNGTVLLAAFQAAADRGVSAEFYDSDDLSGAAQLAPTVIASTDTGLKDGQSAGGQVLDASNSAHFSGYMMVPTSGAYRFYIELEKQEATAELSFAHLTTPLLPMDNNASGNKSAVLELKAGVPYGFTCSLVNLNKGQAKLLVQGETLPKGPLSQLQLYPASTWQVAARSLLLLTKALQLLQTLRISEREIRYLFTHSEKFGDVGLSELPTSPVYNTQPKERAAAVNRFKGFLRLLGYIRLKQDLAPESDDLITIFEVNASAKSDKVKTLASPIAELTRRDSVMVEHLINTLFSQPNIDNEIPLLRLWAALQMVERFGVSVASLRSWANIVNRRATPIDRFNIARDIRETTKARLEPEAWQRVAQPIFDKLRQRQRDALVAHVLHDKGFDRLEQLYEYFLIDPGMEPVVQTSRIRLAISSVQLFIQRCLLNLEPKVHPTAIINAEQWQWMKHYRIWEANRKIFLYPENWLEPEFRDDKSHLFEELEGALLQGDVSRDLVEDAFLNYLRKLDELARLDIVAMHMEEKKDPGQNILHVFGRTYAQPHKYFYRRFTIGVWSPWAPMTVEIQGDHLAPVIWRDRLYLFWVTFIEKAEPSFIPATIDPNSVNTLPGLNRCLEAQLHWSEYFNGQWSTHESGGLDDSSVMKLEGLTLDESQEIMVHVSKEQMDGEEGGVFIHLDRKWIVETPKSSIRKAGSFKVYSLHSFYLAGRNSNPAVKDREPLSYLLPRNPFTGANQRKANRYEGEGPLAVSFTKCESTENGKAPEKSNFSILAHGEKYTLLPLNHEMQFHIPEDAYKNADKPEEVQRMLDSSLAETRSLVRPLFFQDDRHTFFVEPNVAEHTVEKWQYWLVPVNSSSQGEKPGDLWQEGLIEAYVPDRVWGPWPPEDPLYGLDKMDWVVNPATVIRIDDTIIGPQGGLPLMSGLSTPAASQTGMPVYVHAASAVEKNAIFLMGSGVVLEDMGLIQPSGGLNIVGAGGVNSGILQNLDQVRKSGIGANIANIVTQKNREGIL